MSDVKHMLVAESAVNAATATTALNVLLAADVVAAAPGPLALYAGNVSVAVGPIYVASALTGHQ